MNIAVVGAGNGGKNIIESFSDIKGVRISIVVDKKADAPGVIVAKKLGISCSTSVDDINPANTDLIIEVTGIESVINLLEEKFKGKCKIIDSEGALLIMNLVQRDMERMERLNNQVVAINHTTSTVQEQLKNITSSIEQVHNVIEKLLEFTRVSDEYVVQMDEIIQYVNKVAQQTKVLGINATIEAMRAGESGRTFAIVAKEMQGLATDSEENSKGIKGILSKLSQEIKKVNTDVDSLKDFSKIQMDASEGMNAAMDSLIKESGK